jgi:hypothetical protein
MEDAMADYERSNEPATRNPRSSPSSGPWGMSALPLIIAAVIAVLLLVMIMPSGRERVGDTTNTGPSVKTVTTTPTPTTAPVVPGPTPTGEPRPTQAPIQ